MKRRESPTIDRFVVRPNALAAGPWDLLVAIVCCAALVGILAVELATPHTVVERTDAA